MKWAGWASGVLAVILVGVVAFQQVQIAELRDALARKAEEAPKTDTSRVDVVEKVAVIEPQSDAGLVVAQEKAAAEQVAAVARVRAAENSPVLRGGGGGRGSEVILGRVDRFAQAQKLSPEKADALRVLMLDEVAQLREIRAQNVGGARDVAAMRTVRLETDRRVEGLLDPSQVKAYREWRRGQAQRKLGGRNPMLTP